MENEFSQSIVVNKNQTAEVLGSGMLPVFSTPALVALMENTAMQLIETPEGKSSVGISINIKHLKANAVGTTITCIAKLINVDGRKYAFEIQAFDNKNVCIGEALHERVLIDIDKFMSKIN